MKPSYPRVACLVPGCGRGTTRIEPLPPGHIWLEHRGRAPQWICGKHWPTVPRAMKARHRKLKRLYYRNWPKGAIAPICLKREARLLRLVRKSWGRQVAEALAAADRRVTDASLAAFLATI